MSVWHVMIAAYMLRIVIYSNSTFTYQFQNNKRSADHLKVTTPANKTMARSNGYKSAKSSLLSPPSAGQHQVTPNNGFSTPNSKFTPSMNSTPYTGSTSFSSNM